MRPRTRWASLGLILVAVIVAYVASESRLIAHKVSLQPQWDEWWGLEIDGVDNVLRNPASLNSVIEGVFDTNDDSSIDLRTVTIHEGEAYQCLYEASGIDASGYPRRVELTLGIPSFSLCAYDDEQDGEMDWLEVRLSDHRNDKVTYTYTDFDLDGLLDKMEVKLIGNESKTYVLFERAWRLTENNKENSKFTEWIHGEGTEMLGVEFTGSEWVRIK